MPPTLLRSYTSDLHQPLIEHGLTHFAEAGGVGAIDLVDAAILLAEPDALVVNGLHDVP
jgi:hypothetical protein